MDEILRKLADKKNFPNLSKIVVTGHSVGGQFATHGADPRRVTARQTAVQAVQDGAERAFGGRLRARGPPAAPTARRTGMNARPAERNIIVSSVCGA